MRPTGEPSALKGACSVRGKAGGKGPRHRYLACCLSYYDLGEPLPDHSSLTRIRERYGVDIFRRFFEAIVEQCQTAGLVWGKELYFDGTKVAANAGKDSLKPRFFVEAHLHGLFSEASSSVEPESLPVECGGCPRYEQEERPAPAQLPTSLSAEE